MFRKKIVGFVSEIDKFLVRFDQGRKKSESELAEINKYENIHHLRDHPVPTNENKQD